MHVWERAQPWARTREESYSVAGGQCEEDSGVKSMTKRLAKFSSIERSCLKQFLSTWMREGKSQSALELGLLS